VRALKRTNIGVDANVVDIEKGCPVTTFIQRTLPVPATTGTSPGLARFTQSVTDAAAVLVESFDFARAMRSAQTPAARQAVLDRFAA
jgi:hypothetical protein